MVNGPLEKALGECQGDRQMLNRIANLNKQRHLASSWKTSRAEPLAIRVTGPATCSRKNFCHLADTDETFPKCAEFRDN